MGLRWPPAETYMRPGAPPQSRRYVYTGPGEVSSLVTDIPGTPVTPCIKIYYNLMNGRNFTSIHTLHTHTPCLWQGGVCANEVKVRMKGEWRWDEHENEMKDYLIRTRRGERERRGRKHTPTHLARSGPTLKGQGKRKAEGRRTRNKTSGGGGRRKRLNQPDTAKTYTNLSTRRARPTWGGKNAWNRGPMGV